MKACRAIELVANSCFCAREQMLNRLLLAALCLQRFTRKAAAWHPACGRGFGQAGLPQALAHEFGASAARCSACWRSSLPSGRKVASVGQTAPLSGSCVSPISAFSTFSAFSASVFSTVAHAGEPASKPGARQMAQRRNMAFSPFEQWKSAS